jgi:hypothetical protein
MEEQIGISENDFNSLKNQMNEETINQLGISDTDKKSLISMLDKTPDEIELLAKEMIPVKKSFWCNDFYNDGVEHKCSTQCENCIKTQKENEL